MRLVPTVATAAITALTVAGCTLFRITDCGPLDADDCSALVSQIEQVVAREYPGRSIVEIHVLNADGHAEIRLDDDTEIGWGERL